MNLHEPLAAQNFPAVSLEEMRAFLEKDFPQLQQSGTTFVLDALDRGSCRMRLIYETKHLRPGGTISGPAMFMLADVSLYVGTLSVVGIVPLAVTTSITINFLSKPAARDLIADCRMLKAGKRLCVGEVTLYSDGSDEPVAHVTGTYSVPPVRSADSGSAKLAVKMREA